MADSEVVCWVWKKPSFLEDLLSMLANNYLQETLMEPAPARTHFAIKILMSYMNPTLPRIIINNEGHGQLNRSMVIKNFCHVSQTPPQSFAPVNYLLLWQNELFYMNAVVYTCMCGIMYIILFWVWFRI